jgi:hypothetical protein
VSNFDSKSILTIVGTYDIASVSGEITSHNVGDDILTIIYNNSFYQATVDTIPSSDGSNNFSVITEVPNFDSTKVTAILRTTLEIGGESKEVLMEYSQPIPQPENFLDDISELSLSFQYSNSNLTLGCIYPEYPNYDCNARLNNNSCSGDNFTGCGKLVVDNKSVCTCDNERCQDLCEFCGTNEEWRCSSEGFYNPSPNIIHSDAYCTTEPLKPLISFNTSDNIDNLSISDWRSRPNFRVNVNTRDNDDLNAFDTLSFEIHKAVLPNNQNLNIDVEIGYTIDILNQGSISKVIIGFDELFTGTFTLNLEYDDLINWKICLNNILFSKNGNPIEHQYDKSCIELNSDINMNPIDLDEDFDYLRQRDDKLERLFQPAFDYDILSDDSISIQSNESGKLYNQEIELHRGINEISLFANWNGNGDNALAEYFPIKLILDNPIIERIETFNGFIYRDVNGEWKFPDTSISAPPTFHPWDLIDANQNSVQTDTVTGYSYGVALSFEAIRTGLSVPYTLTICSDSSINREVVECYENYNLNEPLVDKFIIDYAGYLPNSYIRLEYKDDNINTPRIRHKPDTMEFGALAANLWSQSSYTLNMGLIAQCKESIYDDISTLLSFEENIPSYIQGPNDTEDMGLQSRFIDLIQYETELITHVDMDFNCEYDENGNVIDGRCYDTWLGTLTTLELGNGYSLNMNDDSFIAGLGDLQNIHPFINMYYDFCGICSGGSTLHKPNSDTDDNAFCINNECYGGVTHSQSCFTDDQRDDICFGNCCLYPDEIIDWYEEIPEYEIGKGKSFGKKLRLCDTLDEYSTYRCSDDKEYPSDDICNSNCNGTCTQINYYKEFNNCNGIFDCFGNCNSESNQSATYDRYGTCCMIGNMDECGVCYGDGTSCNAECNFDFTPSVNITFNVTTLQQNESKNTGMIRTSLSLGEARVSEIIIPISEELKITDVYFDNADSSSIDNFDLFHISVLLDQNKILISSVEDGALLSTSVNYDIPITIEWKINLPESDAEVNTDLNFSNLCMGVPEIYRLDSLLSTTIDSSILDANNCFIDNQISIYGCTDEDAINWNYYCTVEAVNCIENGICEYQGCFGEILNDVNGISQLDDCGVCDGGNADQDCAGECFGTAEELECGCNAPIADGACDCDGNILDCEGECGGSSIVDACGICNGDNSTCTGCTDINACNYNSLAIVNDDSCIYKSTYYLDADDDGLGCLSTAIELCPNNPIIDNGYVDNSNGTEDDLNCLCNGTFDQCGVCNGTNECVGCMDSDAYNYDTTADIECNSTGNHIDDNDCCIYLDDIFDDILSTSYSDGTLDDWLVSNAIDQSTADTNLDGFLEEYGGVQIDSPVIRITQSGKGSYGFSLLHYPFENTISLRDLGNYYFIQNPNIYCIGEGATLGVDCDTSSIQKDFVQGDRFLVINDGDEVFTNNKVAGYIGFTGFEWSIPSNWGHSVVTDCGGNPINECFTKDFIIIFAPIDRGGGADYGYFKFY